MTSLRLRLSPNPFATSRILRGVARLMGVIAVVALTAWPIAHFWGEQALLYWVMLLLPASLFAIATHQRRLAREDAVVHDLCIDDQHVVVRTALGEAFRAPRASVEVVRRLYLTGGRTVMRLPCLELVFEQQRLGIVLADPGQKWPEGATACDATPGHLIATQDWPTLLSALEVPSTTTRA